MLLYWYLAKGSFWAVKLLLFFFVVAAPGLLNGAIADPSTSLSLRHEPVQPLFYPSGLNPEKITLGERLFHDQRLGRESRMSCATCHSLENNGIDGLTRSMGRDKQGMLLNTPTVFNSSLNHRLFWDGRAHTLEAQINFVVEGIQEFATQWPVLLNKLKQDAQYRRSFSHIYSEGITAANVRNAISTFVRSLITINSRFDRWLLGDVNAINSEEKAGYHLFKKYGCIACHQGRNVGGNMFQKLGVFKAFFGHDKHARSHLGRYNVTGKEQDKHVFRVPSLRLVVLTPPYFHDGSAKTLKDAIKVMAEYQLGRNISEQDIESIIAFLKTLPGEYKGRVLSDGATQDASYKNTDDPE